MEQAGKMFVLVAQALEARTLVGQTANRVAGATKSLLTAASEDPTPLLQQFPQASQEANMANFN